MSTTLPDTQHPPHALLPPPPPPLPPPLPGPQKQKIKCAYCPKEYLLHNNLAKHELTHTHPGLQQAPKAVREATKKVSIFCSYPNCSHSTFEYTSHSGFSAHINTKHPGWFADRAKQSKPSSISGPITQEKHNRDQATRKKFVNSLCAQIKKDIPAKVGGGEFQTIKDLDKDVHFTSIFSSYSLSTHLQQTTDKHIYTIQFITLDQFKSELSNFKSEIDFRKVFLSPALFIKYLYLFI